MTTNSAPIHVLESDIARAAIRKRLVRAEGQLGGVVRMLDDGRSCDEIVLQMAAVKKAVATAAISLITASLTECLADNTLDASAVVDVLQKLYLSLA